MVTRARFERATPSFGGWCSIQLSYRATIGAEAPNMSGRASGLRRPWIWMCRRVRELVGRTGLEPVTPAV